MTDMRYNTAGYPSKLRNYLHLDVHVIEEADLPLLPESSMFKCVEYQAGWWLWDLPKPRLITLVELQRRRYSESFVAMMEFAWSEQAEAIHLSGSGDIVTVTTAWIDHTGGLRRGLHLHAW